MRFLIRANEIPAPANEIPGLENQFPVLIPCPRPKFFPGALRAPGLDFPFAECSFSIAGGSLSIGRVGILIRPNENENSHSRFNRPNENSHSSKSHLRTPPGNLIPISIELVSFSFVEISFAAPARKSHYHFIHRMRIPNWEFSFFRIIILI